MITHGTGPGDELDLESILNEFCPEEQVNTPRPQEPPEPPPEPPKAPEPQKPAEPTRKNAPEPHHAPEPGRKNAPELRKASEPPQKGTSEPQNPVPTGDNPPQNAEKAAQIGENPLPNREKPGKQGANPVRSGEKPAQSVEKPLQNTDKTRVNLRPDSPPPEEKTPKKRSKIFKAKKKDDLPAEPSSPPPKKTLKKVPKSEETEEKTDNIVDFPSQEMGLTQRIARLREKGDRYAEGMFRGDEDPDTQELRREQLLPGVDYEDELTHAPTPRKKRVVHHPKPDLTAAQLAGKYKRGLGFLRVRELLVFLLTLLQVYLLLGRGGTLPLPAALADGALAGQVGAVLLALSALLAVDVLLHGLLGIFKLRFELETVLLFAVVATAADAVTMPLLNTREGAMPYTAAASAAIFFALWGRRTKRQAQRQNVRTVAGRKEPYLVTLDEKVWNGEDAYMKWSGELTGFGSQVQDTDGAQRSYHRAAPVILILAVVLTLFASVGVKRPENFFWCLSATLLAGCGFSGFLVFARPYRAIVTRLSKAGAALGGWDSLHWTGRNRGVVVTDGDLFPPGAVKLNGIKLIDDMLSLETAVSYVATLVRETGSGMEKPFSDMMRSQGGLFRRASQVVCHEGGVTGIIGGESVVVGSAGFLELMGIEPPAGLRVKNAVFLGVDGQLAAIFALNYRLHPTVQYALDSLIANHLDPILATRDFLVIPEMLEKKFKLRVDAMEFPSLDRRRELSSKRAEHDENIAALLCREGLCPYAEAVIGGKRLVGATRVGVFFSLLGSLVGMLLAFYLTLAQAYASISAGSLLLFLLIWLVPAVLISGWADRY